MSVRMTREQIQAEWNGLHKRHRMEIAHAVARYCVGNKMSDVAEWLNYSIKWVADQLNFAGVANAVGAGRYDSAGPPDLWEAPEAEGNTQRLRPAIARVLDTYKPRVDIKTGGATGNERVDSITGKDAAAFQPYVDHYLVEGHTAPAAIRLAKAEFAAESAIEAGVIQELKDEKDRRVNRIEFTDDPSDTFDIRLQTHLTQVEAAARFLDGAKVAFLRKKSTCAKVAEANEKWLEQIERMRNFHPTFDKV